MKGRDIKQINGYNRAAWTVNGGDIMDPPFPLRADEGAPALATTRGIEEFRQ